MASGAAEAEETDMNCQCALSYHNSLLQGCKMQIHYSLYPTLEEYEKALELCNEKSLKSSAFLTKFENDLYFKHGHARCLPNGNYDPIQCVDEYEGLGEICVCVQPWQEVGDHLTPNGTSAFPSTITDLHCFNESIHTKEYYRPCEKVVRDLEVIEYRFVRLFSFKNAIYPQLKSLNVDEFFVIPAEKSPICSPDGYYAALQTDKNFNHCTDRNGDFIEDFHHIDANSTEGRSMNCACAQTRNYLSPLKHKPKCCKNGNFEAIQCLAGFCYCVDEFGIQTKPEVEQSQVNQLDCNNQDFCCEGNSTDDFCKKFQ